MPDDMHRPDDKPAPTVATRRSSGSKGDSRDTVAELSARANEISADANSRMAGAIRDVINSAAGVAGFAVESARDLVQFMVRRGQMTPAEAERLLREAEAANARRQPARAAGESAGTPSKANRDKQPSGARSGPAKAAAPAGSKTAAPSKAKAATSKGKPASTSRAKSAAPAKASSGTPAKGKAARKATGTAARKTVKAGATRSKSPARTPAKGKKSGAPATTRKKR